MGAHVRGGYAAQEAVLGVAADVFDEDGALGDDSPAVG
jgi:hypothetical protein